MLFTALAKLGCRSWTRFSQIILSNDYKKEKRKEVKGFHLKTYVALDDVNKDARFFSDFACLFFNFHYGKNILYQLLHLKFWK